LTFLEIGMNIVNSKSLQNIYLSDIPSKDFFNLAFPMQVLQEMPKTIIFRNTNYTRLRTKVHKFIEDNWREITILDVKAYKINTDGPEKRIIKIIYERDK